MATKHSSENGPGRDRVVPKRELRCGKQETADGMRKYRPHHHKRPEARYVAHEKLAKPLICS